MNRTSKDFTVWEGIYPTYADAPESGPGFSSDTWLERVRQRMLAQIAQPADEIGRVRERNLLPIVAAMTSRHEQRLIVLDFGGGPGVDFLAVSRGLSAKVVLEYHVVDNPQLCALGRDLFAGEPRLHFHSQIPELSEVTIVHAGSALQYIQDWPGLLAVLCAPKPDYVLLSDIFAVEGESFASVQNLWGSQVPHWFLSNRDLLSTMERSGYQLVYRVPYMSQILGREGPLPMENFPPEYRLKHTSHFLFQRAERKE